MIADLDETIRQLLIKNIPIRNNEIDIKFDQPKREWSARLSKPTVNLFLYDIRENPNLRRQMFENVRKTAGWRRNNEPLIGSIVFTWSRHGRPNLKMNIV